MAAGVKFHERDDVHKAIKWLREQTTEAKNDPMAGWAWFVSCVRDYPKTYTAETLPAFLRRYLPASHSDRLFSRYVSDGVRLPRGIDVLCAEIIREAKEGPNPAVVGNPDSIRARFDAVKKANGGGACFAIFSTDKSFEMYFGDALLAGEKFGAYVTTMIDCGSTVHVSGFPHHAFERHARRIIGAGYSVAVVAGDDVRKLASIDAMEAYTKEAGLSRTRKTANAS